MKLKLVVSALVAVVGLLVGPEAALAAPSTNQQFFLNSPEGSTEVTVTAVGVFNGVGEDIVIDETFEEGKNGKFTFTGNDEFVFDEGRLFVSIDGRGRFEFNEETCSGSGTGRGTYDITGGKGLFKKAKGGGTFTFDFAFTGERVDGECVEEESSGVFFAKLMGKLKLKGSMAEAA